MNDIHSKRTVLVLPIWKASANWLSKDLIWGLQQDDIDLKLTVLQLLQEHYGDAESALQPRL